MRITIVQTTNCFANLTLSADNQTERETLRDIFGSGFCSSSSKAHGGFSKLVIGIIKPDAMETLAAVPETLRMITAAGAQLSEIVAFSSTVPRPESVSEPDDGFYSTGHKVPTCNECGIDLHREGDHWKCGQCERTFSMKQVILAQVKEGIRQAD